MLTASSLHALVGHSENQEMNPMMVSSPSTARLPGFLIQSHSWVLTVARLELGPGFKSASDIHILPELSIWFLSFSFVVEKLL